VETKVCSKCKIEKSLEDFQKDKGRPNGYCVYCKECRKLNYQLNSEVRKEQSKKYYQKIKEKKHDIILERNRLWRKNNPTYTTDRKKIDPTFKLIKNIRRRLNRFISFTYFTKKNTTINLIGCPPDELRLFLEQKFKDNMSWDNYGEWHIDHIIPLSSAKTEEELCKLCHYTNLQPLWAKDNLIKSNKLDYLYITDNPIL
jgi:hypothetical protein